MNKPWKPHVMYPSGASFFTPCGQLGKQYFQRLRICSTKRCLPSTVKPAVEVLALARLVDELAVLVFLRLGEDEESSRERFLEDALADFSFFSFDFFSLDFSLVSLLLRLADCFFLPGTLVYSSLIDLAILRMLSSSESLSLSPSAALNGAADEEPLALAFLALVAAAAPFALAAGPAPASAEIGMSSSESLIALTALRACLALPLARQHCRRHKR
mmetsp:Transcript_4194/g.10649  ORF Transcript_4194/g.10649 Transcript_4194/m.10649 type:complete len:216 (+) Transcript_4194:1682-2329(+)